MKLTSRKSRGFTLIELMVTVAVAIVALAIGIPFYDSIVANNRAASQVNMFVSAVNLAKSEAVAQNTFGTVCANASNTNVTESTLACATSADQWVNGFFVFIDLDGDGVRDSGETVLKLWQALETGSSITDSGRFALTYTSTGENAGAAAQYEYTQSGSTGNQTRCIIINPVGQIRIERNACS